MSTNTYKYNGGRQPNIARSCKQIQRQIRILQKLLQSKRREPKKNHNKKHVLLSFEHYDANLNYTGGQDGVL